MSTHSHVSMTSEIREQQLAEAEGLSAEALRMANEAKLAAAQLAEVKKSLAMFSSKLEKAEQNILAAEQSEEADTAPTPSVITKTDVEDSKIAEEVETVTPTSVASSSSIDSFEEPKMTASEAHMIRYHVGRVPYKKGAIEGFFDGIGLDKACGYDDESLGLVPKPVPTPFEAAYTEFKNV